jgi:hypothetical protein
MLIVLIENSIYFALIKFIFINNFFKFFENLFSLIILLLLRFIKFVNSLLLLAHYLVFF